MALITLMSLLNEWKLTGSKEDYIFMHDYLEKETPDPKDRKLTYFWTLFFASTCWPILLWYRIWDKD